MNTKTKAEKKQEKLAKFQAKQKVETPIVVKEKKKKEGGYDPEMTEKYWSEYWIKNKTFLPKESEKKFVIVLPPPNITGSLHIGHAMMLAIEDCIVRYKRLNGYETVFIPGLDHAGIATQTVVMKNMKKNNEEITRKSFMESALQWSKTYSDRIISQLNRMGSSLDYTRQAFTMSEEISKSVNKAFCTLYNKGLIYRDSKMTSWCGKLKTSLSDLEVNYKSVSGGSYIDVDDGKYKFGCLYYIKYYLVPDEKYIYDFDNLPYVIIATSRPETIMGDSAICINPEDERFKNLDFSMKRENEEQKNITGEMRRDRFYNVKNDLERFSLNDNDKFIDEEVLADKKDCSSITDSNKINSDLAVEIKMEKKNKYKANKENIVEKERRANFYAINPITLETIPVIIDSHADMSFGTGVLKVTPCHDMVDFKLGKKHNLKFIKIMDENNKICHSKFYGMKRFEARKAIVEELRSKKLLEREELCEQILPFCSRSGDIIEPCVKEQWWCDCKEMARRSIEAVKSGDIELYPEEAKATWYRWLENIKDWCLSRQLWWGHQIPAYRASKDGQEEWIVAETEEEAWKIAKTKGYASLVQDEDVLDTWFSSGLWPFATLGWPENTVEFEKYFPNSLLETGNDILFFWVARMVMLSFVLLDKKPFDRIFLHGIVRDAHGMKMSKSLGNVIDPLYVIDGITLDEMISNLSKGNLEARELVRASAALKKDYPSGIQKCGADALRFTLLSYTNGMKDINLDVLRVEGYSRFCNKIWNAYKFVSGLAGENFTFNSNNIKNTIYLSSTLSSHQKWIVVRLNKVIEEQHKNIDIYNFMAASQSVYQLFFDFCDVIIECSKTEYGYFCNFDGKIENQEDYKNFIIFIFIKIIKLLNPYMPYITEDIHYKLTSSIIIEYPVILEGNFTNDFEDILKVCKICRSNSKVMIERNKFSDYFRILGKGSVVLTDSLVQDYDKCGSIKYKIID